MPDQTLFEQGNQPQETPAPQSNAPTESLFADQLKTIVDETGRQKYSSPEEALKALKHSQEYIPSLKGQLSQYEQEIARLKAELEQRSSVEDLVSRLKEPQQEPKDVTPTPAGLDEEAALKLVESVLTQKEKQTMAQTNLAMVEQSLIEKYGDKAQETLKQKAGELGLTLEQLKRMSEETPKVVMNLFGHMPAPMPKPSAGGYQAPAPVPQEQSLADRLAEAERKIKMSGINRSGEQLISQLRKEMEAKFSYQR